MCPPEEEENNGSTPPKKANRVSEPKPDIKALLERTLPYLLEAGSKSPDDNDNEALCLARAVEIAIHYGRD